MGYQIDVAKPVDKKFARRFPKEKDRNKIIQTFGRLKSNPRPPGCKKLIKPLNGYRVWAGRDIRILYTIDDTAKMVRVYKVDYRSSSTLYMFSV